MLRITRARPGRALREPGGRFIATAAAASASGALAVAACCILPFAFPAVVLAGGGSIIAWLMGAQGWMLALAFLAVAGRWFWIAWQSLHRKARPTRTLLGIMGGATLLLALAVAWLAIEPGLIRLLL